MPTVVSTGVAEVGRIGTPAVHQTLPNTHAWCLNIRMFILIYVHICFYFQVLPKERIQNKVESRSLDGHLSANGVADNLSGYGIRALCPSTFQYSTANCSLLVCFACSVHLCLK